MSEWKEGLPEQLRDAPFIGKAENLDDAVAKLVHAAKLVGTSIRIPGSDASDDDKAAFFDKLKDIEGVTRMPLSDDEDGYNEVLTKLGKPAEYTEYKLPEIADFEWDDTVGSDLRKYALEAGMTKKQFNTFAKKIGEQEMAAGLESSQALDDVRKALRSDWGDTLEEREDMIRGWMDKSDAPEHLRDALNDRNLPVDTMNWLYKTAQQFKGEVTPVKRDGSSNDPGVTPAEAREKIPTIIQDLMQLKDSDPRYRDLQKKLVQYQKLANPPQAA